MSPQDKADVYRRRADTLRQSVADSNDMVAREVMEKIAAKYDQVACNLDRFVSKNGEANTVYLIS